jgi:hypothetical protein
MSDADPRSLADQLEREAEKLQRRSRELQDEVKGVGEDWERKRADQSTPGAPPPEPGDDEGQEERSPAPEAPPPEEGPSESETASEGAVGPPSDTGD